MHWYSPAGFEGPGRVAHKRRTTLTCGEDRWVGVEGGRGRLDLESERVVAEVRAPTGHDRSIPRETKGCLQDGEYTGT